MLTQVSYQGFTIIKLLMMQLNEFSHFDYGFILIIKFHYLLAEIFIPSLKNIFDNYFVLHMAPKTRLHCPIALNVFFQFALAV